MSPPLIVTAVAAGAGLVLAIALAVSYWRLRRELIALGQRVEAIEVEPRTEEVRSAIPPLAPIAMPARATPAPHATRRDEPGVAPAGGGRRLAAETAEVITAYNALAAQYGQPKLDAFVQRWRPDPVAWTAEDRLVDDPKGEFWVIRTGRGTAGEARGVIVPGPEIVRKWEIYYRSMGSLAAKNLLGALYELGEDVPLRLERPAAALETGQGWAIDSPGKFAES